MAPRQDTPGDDHQIILRSTTLRSTPTWRLEGGLVLDCPNLAEQDRLCHRRFSRAF